MTMRPFRFGVSLRSAGSATEWSEKAQRAEALGYDIALMPDHLVELLPPMVGLAAIANATEHLRIGTLVLNNDFRHPVVVAREAAALDLLSRGRFELGIGAGHMAQEYTEAGIRFEEPAVRVARLGESAEVLEQLLSGEETSFEGEHYRVQQHTIHPFPVQRPVPLLIGGNGKRLLGIAGSRANIVSFTGFFPTEDGAGVRLSHFTAEGLAERIAIVREAAGERFGEIELNVLVQAVVVTDDREAAGRELQRRSSALTLEQVLESPFLLIGTHAQIAEQLRERRERFGVSYIAVFEPEMEALGPVVQELGGR